MGNVKAAAAEIRPTNRLGAAIAMIGASEPRSILKSVELLKLSGGGGALALVESGPKKVYYYKFLCIHLCVK